MSRAASRAASRGSGRSVRAPASRVQGDLGLGHSGYLGRSQLPLTCLLFLLPFLALYEIGTRFWGSDPVRHTQQRIIAFTWLQKFFYFCHAGGTYLPAMAIVGVLLAWHIARKDAWELDFATATGMGLESAVLSLPLLALSWLASRQVPGRLDGSAVHHLVSSIGAGIYEEFLFRLVAFTLLTILLVDWLRFPPGRSAFATVCGSALLFAAYHYLGNETFQLRSFVFRTTAGIYFGLLFLFRGFGITAGVHAAYDISIVTLVTMSGPR
jgi:hypothetical protein